MYSIGAEMVGHPLIIALHIVITVGVPAICATTLS